MYMSIPNIVFIIPYRDREEQLFFFKRYIKYILEDYEKESYRIFYVHQCDKRTFNRGALKNIGFLVVKELYPNNYNNITLVFNDLDTIPHRKNLLNYETTNGNIKHFYGFEFTLGGIVSITCSDFELINGFPNFWSWGYEDNLLQTRAESKKLKIDRSHFYKLMNPCIIHLNESITRVVNRGEYNRYVYNSTEGITDIKQLKYVFDGDFINVSFFETKYNENVNDKRLYDITKSDRPFGNTREGSMKMIL